MKWKYRFKAQPFINLMLSVALVLSLSPHLTAAALPSGDTTTEPANLLIYKNFGEDAYTAVLPTECVENCDQDSTDYYKPTANPTPSGRSGLEEVATPGMWPYTPTVKLFSHWPSGETTACSGMLVSALTLITSAQCVYTRQAELCKDGNPPCWVDDLEAIPAYDNGEAPYGESGYQTILTWTAWTENQNSAYDLAAVQLRHPIGAALGWLGVGFNAEDAYFPNNEFNSTSYPDAGPYNGETMASWTGTLINTDTDFLYQEDQSDNGQIGASVNGANRVAYGVLTNPDAGGNTTFTRITYEKFDAIRAFIEAGQPKYDHAYFFPVFLASN